MNIAIVTFAVRLALFFGWEAVAQSNAWTVYVFLATLNLGVVVVSGVEFPAIPVIPNHPPTQNI